MENKFSQKIKGNDNVQQHIETQIINQYSASSVTEEQVRAISIQTALEICREYNTLSSNLINERLNNFEKDVIDRIGNIEHALDEFSNPSFVWQYKQAQIQAAISGEENSYKLLCELLVHRIKRKENKYSQTGINGAIKIVSELSDSCLSALTILCCVLRIVHPMSLSIDEGLENMNTLYGLIIKDSTLPTGYDWLDQLDILNAIRINQLSSFPKFSEIAVQIFRNYIAIGIKKETEGYKKALLIQEKIGINLMVENPLLSDYVILPFSKEQIDRLNITINGQIIQLNTIPEIIEIFDLYEKNAIYQKKALSKFMDMLDSYNYLKIVHDWWDKIDRSCSLTAIGRVLGHANAKKSCPNFPDID